MDFNLREDQQLLKDSVERFVRENYAIERRNAIAKSEDGFDRRLWAEFAELGWLGMPLPEDLGGLGGTPIDTMIVMEAFGRGLVLEPYLPTIVLGGTALVHGGSAGLKSELVPKLADGSLHLALAIAEPQSRYELCDVATTARRQGSGYVLSGEKIVVFNGAAADRLIVTARTAGGQRDEKGLTLFLVERGRPGVSVRPYGTVDEHRAADIRLDGVAVGSDQVLGTVDNGADLLRLVIDHGLAALVAESLGAMEALHAMTVAYAKTRQQFGAPIGSFQVIQHRLVEMYQACEETRSMAYMAALKLAESNVYERSRAQAAAKVYAGRAGRRVGQEAVQIHGGVGMTEELACGHYFKRLTMIDHTFGDTDYHLDRVARLGRQIG